MSTNVPATMNGTAIVEAVVTKGDLSDLTPEQKARYYIQICESLGLNPYTQPFGIYALQGKQVMYAKKDAAEQLRRRHRVSIVRIERDVLDGVLLVTVTARTPDGREDADIGAVNIANLKGEALANAIMKGITKGKRRVTLSLCGLGMLDETEVETIQGARPYDVNVETGEIIERDPPAPAAIAARTAFGEGPNELREAMARHDITENDLYLLARIKGFNDYTGFPAETIRALCAQARRSQTAGIQDWFAKQFAAHPELVDAARAELEQEPVAAGVGR